MKMNREIYNSVFEISVRIAMIINTSDLSLDLQRLVYYDYTALHLNDIDNSKTSLHPSNPFHSTELFVRREMIKESLNLLINKGLLDLDIYPKQGIYYKPNSFTKDFLNYFECSYFKKLYQNVEYAVEILDDFQDNDLSDYFNKNIKKWTGEFEFEAVFRGKLIEK